MDNHLLRNIGTYTRSIQYLCDRKYRDLNLQKGQFMFLMRICEHPGISQQELSDLIAVDKSTTTRALQKLEKDRYIMRTKQTGDTRKTAVTPTEKGLSIYPELARYELALLKKLHSRLTGNEIQILTGVFEKLTIPEAANDNGIILQGSELHIRVADHQKILDDCFHVREVVFQKGQGVSAKLDFDGKDGESINFAAYFGGEIAATVRLRPVSHEKMKLERMAVLPEFRNRSIASAMVEYCSVYALAKHYKTIVLHSQLTAKSIYQRAGYQTVGDLFQEAGIDHIEMIKNLV